MRADVGNLKAFARADLDFHNALAAAAGNDTLVDLLHVVRSLLQVYADRAVHDEAEALIAIAEHDAVYPRDRGGGRGCRGLRDGDRTWRRHRSAWPPKRRTERARRRAGH